MFRSYAVRPELHYYNRFVGLWWTGFNALRKYRKEYPPPKAQLCVAENPFRELMALGRVCRASRGPARAYMYPSPPMLARARACGRRVLGARAGAALRRLI